MISNFMQLLIYFLALLVCIKPLGLYMAKIYSDKPHPWVKSLARIESWFYRLCGIEEQVEMNWKQYATAVLSFSLISFLAVYAIQRFQGLLPLNPESLTAVSPDSSFNTAISFVTNTNWQGYAGETTMSYMTQMLALTVQNFVSAGVGMAVLVALARGLSRRSSPTIGNFWVDLTRGTVYVLLPLSILLSVVLVSQGVVQTLSSYQEVTLLEPTLDGANQPVTAQKLAVGPAASQIAIKQLGTNGGGFFNVNSAHPFENPTPLSNFLQMVAILMIPAALCYTFGELVGVIVAKVGQYLPLCLSSYCRLCLEFTLLSNWGIRSWPHWVWIKPSVQLKQVATWKARKPASELSTQRFGRLSQRLLRTAL